MLNFCDFIQVYVFTTNHHLNVRGLIHLKSGTALIYCYYLFAGGGIGAGGFSDN